jgi:hypothetical protein
MQTRAAAGTRHRRSATFLLTVTAVFFAVWWARPHHGNGATAPPAPPAPPAARTGLLSWHMPKPISREVVTAGPDSQLIVLGGLTTGRTPVDGVYAVRTVTGTTRRIGTLTAPLHDAAAAASGGRVVVFGGGSPGTAATVRSFPLSGRGGRGTDVGSLPAPRSDAQAVTIGRTMYLVGGCDGSKPDAPVLATADGRTFRAIATLPVPVRYPAVAALGGQVLVFGGQAITGPHAGTPVRAIQEVDPARHTAAVIGSLPEPLAAATAATVDGELFVAGGESSAGSSSATGTVSAIWAYDPASRRLLAAGRLRVPVSHAAVAVTGSTAWIVGGESNGTQVSSVQTLRPDR